MPTSILGIFSPISWFLHQLNTNHPCMEIETFNQFLAQFKPLLRHLTGPLHLDKRWIVWQFETEIEKQFKTIGMQ